VKGSEWDAYVARIDTVIARGRKAGWPDSLLAFEIAHAAAAFLERVGHVSVMNTQEAML
jgi:hypothetical protein